MRVVVTGASGFIGSHLTAALLAAGTLAGRDGQQHPIREIVAIDVVPPLAEFARDPRVRGVVGDASDPPVLAQVMKGGADSVFALGATLTADAEAHFAHGMEVNLHGMLRLLEACRLQADVPRFVFTSSIAAFGGPLPETVNDEQALTPQTSYGTQKAINELLINDYSRRGSVDGRTLRLPIVLVRPGSPGSSISDRVAGIVREPLRGHDMVCPLRPDTLIPIASARAIARALVQLHDLPAAAFGHTRSMNLPSLSVRVGELVQAVESIAQRRPWARPLGRITWGFDAAMQAVVSAWPQRFASAQAEALGVRGDASVDEIIGHFIEDYLVAPA